MSNNWLNYVSSKNHVFRERFRPGTKYSLVGSTKIPHRFLCGGGNPNGHLCV